jgi:hypothetical protein
MAAAGHYVATCYTAEDAVTVLREYCGLELYSHMEEPNNSIWKENSISAVEKERKTI